MQKVNVRQERCKQCGICIANCPKEAISFAKEINLNGYRPAVVDDDKCISCGNCYTMCPDWVFEILGEEN